MTNFASQLFSKELNNRKSSSLLLETITKTDERVTITTYGRSRIIDSMKFRKRNLDKIYGALIEDEKSEQ